MLHVHFQAKQSINFFLVTRKHQKDETKSGSRKMQDILPIICTLTRARHACNNRLLVARTWIVKLRVTDIALLTTSRYLANR